MMSAHGVTPVCLDNLRTGGVPSSFDPRHCDLRFLWATASLRTRWFGPLSIAAAIASA